jgi:hypothetical protein
VALAAGAAAAAAAPPVLAGIWAAAAARAIGAAGCAGGAGLEGSAVEGSWGWNGERRKRYSKAAASAHDRTGTGERVLSHVSHLNLRLGGQSSIHHLVSIIFIKAVFRGRGF